MERCYVCNEPLTGDSVDDGICPECVVLVRKAHLILHGEQTLQDAISSWNDRLYLWLILWENVHHTK